ncbi:hypothetical protein HMPREF1012_03879 [Bacillus sp. BT1B_CT2]|nr:hypothetical protein HMPREF1012_03879 [Bacillus sp. BT1B_CT2]
MSLYKTGGETMAVYSIAYDLNKIGQSYDKLHKEIKKLGPYFHAMESYWFVDTNYSADTIYALLKSALDSNDLVFITKVTNSYYGLLDKEAWAWLKPRL